MLYTCKENIAKQLHVLTKYISLSLIIQFCICFSDLSRTEQKQYVLVTEHNCICWHFLVVCVVGFKYVCM